MYPALFFRSPGWFVEVQGGNWKIAAVAPFLSTIHQRCRPPLHVNALDNLWSLGNNDARGDLIADKVDNTNFIVLNDPNVATRPSSFSSPDIAFALTNIAVKLNRSVASTLNSDHIPTTILFDDDIPPCQLAKSFVNFHKANWQGFKRDTEAQFASTPLPSSCAQGEKIWRRILQKVSARNVPSGNFKEYHPSRDPVSARLVAEHDDVRKNNPNNPSIPGLNHQIAASIAAASRQRWMETVKEANQKLNPRRYWNLLKSLSNKQVNQAPNQPIKFGNRIYTKDSSTANSFCKQ